MMNVNDLYISVYSYVHISHKTGSQTSQSQSPVNSQKLSTKHRYSDSRIKKQSTPPSSSFPTVHSSSPRSVSSIRERLYACKSAGKKYIVTRDISPQQEGDLVLTKGMEIEGTCVYKI